MIIKEGNIRVNNYICSCALLFDNVQGNSTTKKSVSDVVTRQRQNRDKTINITVQKRNNVDWNYVVDSSGNKTTVGL